MIDKKESIITRIVSAFSKEGTENTTNAMDKLVTTIGSLPQVDDVVEGTITALGRSSVFVDISPYGTGIIYGREYMNARDVLRKIAVGETLTAKIVSVGTHEDGYIELSLKEARQALVWNDAEVAMKANTVLNLEIKDANKGGLILEWQGIQGFLPASQLTHEHYPRVEDGDKDKIFEELKNLVGTFISVNIITVDAKDGKLIFSEKGLKKQSLGIKKSLGYNVGDILTGEVTGVVDFGIFVKIEEGLEGLVHISELDWGLVDNTRARHTVGDVIRVKVIDVKSNKISLSIKQLKENPWEAAAKKYKKGDQVEGVVIKHNAHGALVSIEEGVAGLVHVSEFESETDLRNTLNLGQSYKFKISLFVPKDQRMTLTFHTVNPVK